MKGELSENDLKYKAEAYCSSTALYAGAPFYSFCSPAYRILRDLEKFILKFPWQARTHEPYKYPALLQFTIVKPDI